ncbi:MAG: DUF427 domain-containing protein [Myxococcales bacterium]|nr:DUF427 domain-containing protein [Myxococcales bacterium]
MSDRIRLHRIEGNLRLRLGDKTVAEVQRAVHLDESGFPSRLYLPREELPADQLRASPTRTTCPYKGVASYHDLVFGEDVVREAAWSYDDPIDAVAAIRGHLCFDPRHGFVVDREGAVATPVT